MTHTRFMVCLGLLASSLAIATVARADIPITGGQTTGQAAFFTPTNVPSTTTPTFTRNGAPVLFDTLIQTLRIETPNGTTTTSRFLPNASRFTDANNNNRPDAGDRGRLEGALSGVAFTRSGSPVFFQNIPTALNFTLNSFNPATLDAGSLINPKQEGTAPLVFLPGVNVTLSNSSSASFDSRFGLLEIGSFAASLTGDFIGLPSDLQLRPAATEVTLVPVVLGRRIKFDFEGKNAQVEESFFGVDAATGRRVLGYTGEVTDFQIQSVGTPGTREFKINGSGALDITLTAPFDVKQDSLNLNTVTPGSRVDYRIKGEGPGYVGFTGDNSIAYSGTSRRATDFKFEQGNRRFEGKSDGDVSFVVNDRRDNINFGSFNVPVVGFTTTTASGVPFVAVPSLTANVTVTSTATSTTTSSVVFSTTVFNTNSITIFPTYRNLVRETYQDDDSNDDRVLYGTNRTYYVYAQGRAATEVVIERQGDRILVVDRTETRGRKLKKRGQVVSAYQVVGLPSRVFPGLVGLRQLPPEQVQAANEAELETAEAVETEAIKTKAIEAEAIKTEAIKTEAIEPEATSPAVANSVSVQPVAATSASTGTNSTP